MLSCAEREEATLDAPVVVEEANLFFFIFNGFIEADVLTASGL